MSTPENAPKTVELHLLVDLFKKIKQMGGSDLHLRTFSAPYIRNRDGDMERIVLDSWEVKPELGKEVMDGLLLLFLSMIDQSEKVDGKQFWKGLDEDGSSNIACSTELLCDPDGQLTIPKLSLRVHVERVDTGLAIMARVERDDEYQTLEALGFDPTRADRMRHFCQQRSGLFLVTGPMGMGKTTTLRSMLNWINFNQRDHIVTLQDPIEIRIPPASVNPKSRCLVTNRGIGETVKSFAEGLRDVLRSDVNKLMVGEIRDRQTMDMVFTAASSGISVFGTLHTKNSVETIEKIYSYYPSDEANYVAHQLSYNLNCMVSQMLVPRANKKGRILIYDYLENSTRISNAIQSGQSLRINQNMQPPCMTRNECIRMRVDSSDLTEDDMVAYGIDYQNGAKE